MSINPNIFKAYDVRGLYPEEVNEEAARLIGRGFVAYLAAKRIAVSRDMRLSSPSMAAAFIEGAHIQGPCFVDEGSVVKAGARILPYSVIGRQTHIEEGATVDGSIIWPNGWIGPDALLRGSILGRNCHVGRNARIESPSILGDKTVITDYSSI